MKVVDSILQAEKLAHIKISLASHLATLNFVGYAFFLPKYFLLPIFLLSVFHFLIFILDKAEDMEGAMRLFSKL